MFNFFESNLVTKICNKDECKCYKNNELRLINKDFNNDGLFDLEFIGYEYDYCVGYASRNPKDSMPRDSVYINYKYYLKEKNADYHYSLVDNKYTTTYAGRKISIYRDKELLQEIILPNCEDVKNLEFDSIADTEKGFNLYFEWGDIKYQHANVFVFETKNKKIYLTRIKTKIYEAYSDTTSYYNNQIKPVLLKNISFKEIYESKIHTL